MIMRNIVLIMILFCSLTCLAQTAEGEVYTFSEDGNDILVKDEYVTQPTLEEYTNIEPYTLVSNIIFNIDYCIEFLNYKGWESESGAYRVVRIHYGGNKILEIIDEDAWIYTSSRFQEYSFTTTNNEALMFSLENNVTVIVLIGYTYASQPPKLTIIAIKDDIAKVVFNQPFVLRAIDKDADNIELLLADIYEGEDTPNYYKLYSTSTGTMIFEKVD